MPAELTFETNNAHQLFCGDVSHELVVSEMPFFSGSGISVYGIVVPSLASARLASHVIHFGLPPEEQLLHTVSYSTKSETAEARLFAKCRVGTVLTRTQVLGPQT